MTAGPAAYDPREPGMGWLAGGAHWLPLRVYWEDTDASGIVYHASYLRFFERGRSETLRLAGVAQQTLLTEATAFAVRRMTLDYARPARLDDALLVRSQLTALGGASLDMLQTLSRGGEALVTADIRIACIDPVGKPKRIPRAVAALLATLLPNS
jgi:acyl-CoA thioester hydrolase